MKALGFAALFAFMCGCPDDSAQRQTAGETVDTTPESDGVGTELPDEADGPDGADAADVADVGEVAETADETSDVAIPCEATTCSGHGTCEPQGGAPICHCDQGFTGARCDACADGDGYHPDGTGGCTQDPCLPNPCNTLHQSVCSVAGGGTTCGCDPGFHAGEGGGACTPDEACLPTTCNGHGNCSDVGGTLACTCNTGWAGASCEACDTAGGYHAFGSGPTAGCTRDQCQPNPCTEAHRSDCRTGDDAPVCACDAGYHLDADRCVLDETCTPASCSGHGTCAVSLGRVVCRCALGFVGATCDACDSVSGYHADGVGGCTTDVCRPNPCTGVHATACTGGPAGAVCGCDPGYHAGAAGACDPDASCLASTCNGHGVCAAPGGIPSCTCDAGWGGAACDTCAVAQGYHADGQGGCTTDPCTPNPCTTPGMGECAVANGSASCGCDAGTHPDGAGGCTSDPCVPNPCTTGPKTACQADAGTGTECVCPAALHDDGAGGCTADPCLPNPCTVPHQTECAASGGAALCGCSPGYHDDAAGGCTSDPCTPNPCTDAHESVCSAAGADATCACDPGYHASAGDGACVADESCLPTSCNGHGTCSAPGGVVGCACEAAWSGTACDACNAAAGYHADGAGGCTTDACLPNPCGPGATCNQGTCTIEACDPDGEICTSDVPIAGACVYAPVASPTCACANVTGGHAVAIDIPTVTITFGLMLDGQPVSAQNTSDADEGGLRLVDIVTGDVINLDQAWSGSATPYPLTRHILPGTYDVYYFNDGAVAHWPINNDSILLAGVVLDADQTLVVDVATATVTFNLTLDGAPVTSANTSDADEGGLRLVDTTTGDVINLDQAWSGSATPYPLTRRILPGTYDVYYYNDGAVLHWPINNDSILRQDLVITGDGPVDLDVATARVTFALTLDGQPVTSANTSDADEGGLRLVDTTTGDVINLDQAWSGSATPYPLTRRILPGSYDLYYYNDGAVANWPVNNNSILLQHMVVSGDATLPVDVRTARVTFQLTLDGAPVTSANTSDADEGGLRLVDVTTGDVINLDQAWSGSATPYPLTRRILPGTYDIYYYNDGATAHWPINNNSILQKGVVITGDATLAIDVPTATTTFTLTLDGAAITAANTSDADEGGLRLVDTTTGDVIALDQAWSGSATPYPLTRRILPGTYDVFYYNDGATTHWPINNNAKLRAGVVVSGDGVIAIDVRAVPIDIALTLDGAAVTSANTSDADEGVLHLVDATTGDIITLDQAWSGSKSPYPLARRILPGAYGVFYANDGAVAHWPINNDARAGCIEVTP